MSRSLKNYSEKIPTSSKFDWKFSNLVTILYTFMSSAHMRVGWTHTVLKLLKTCVSPDFQNVLHTVYRYIVPNKLRIMLLPKSILP